MRLLVVADYDELSVRAAEMVAEAIAWKPNIVLGLATGGTPGGCYRELVRMHRERGLSFAKVATFNLDEYLRLPPSHVQSYRYYMDENLFNLVDVKRENIHFLDGLTMDPERTCREYENAIKASGGIDFQLLGIGSNGHIAFNEPSSSFQSRTRVISLSEQTRNDNARFFHSLDEVPRQALTMGIATILEARVILLLASGVGKAEAVAKSVEGSVTEMVPASILRTHINCTMLVDRDAAVKLTMQSLSSQG